MGTLRFYNLDATPKLNDIECSWESVPYIMEWYGAFFAGDRYSVSYNSDILIKDVNGCLIHLHESDNVKS